MALKAARTRSPSRTIWSIVPEDEFRENLVQLERLTNAVPLEVQTFDLPSAISESSTISDQLPVHVEQEVADDFAYLAAAQQGAQSVAAVCLEQDISRTPSLLLRIAAADVIDESMKSNLEDILNILTKQALSPSQFLREGPNEILRIAIRSHRDKLLGRLRSIHWAKPKYLAASHKKPLWQDFANLLHRIQHVYPRKGDVLLREQVEAQIVSLEEAYKAFECMPQSEWLSALGALVMRTFSAFTNEAVKDFVMQLEMLRPTAQISAALKCVRQLEKIAAYYKIARRLVTSAMAYPKIFNSIDMICLMPYASTPTSIAHESWAQTCHVHAEVQLAIEHDLHDDGPSSSHTESNSLPKIIGTSKYLCYLCYLFLRCHGTFHVANTHGRLYDQWTIPDLSEFSIKIKNRYASVITQMNEIVCTEIQKEPHWRAEPMTSRQDLSSASPSWLL